MKRLMALLMLLALCMAVLPAHADGPVISFERVVTMALHMRSMACGDYLTIKGVPDNLQQIARGWAEGITDAPRLVVRLDVQNASYLVETRAIFRLEPAIVSYEAESNSLVEMMQYLTVYAAASGGVAATDYAQINEVNGLICPSMLYPSDTQDGYALYIVLYDDAAPIVIMANSENGAVFLEGWFLPSDQLQRCTNYGQVSMYFLLNGFPVTGEEVLPE